MLPQPGAASHYWVRDPRAYRPVLRRDHHPGLEISALRRQIQIIFFDKQALQTFIGILIDSLVVGLFFVKISRPGRRASTIVFSKNAVITKRNGRLQLIFQVTNLQSSQLIGKHISRHESNFS